MTENEGVTGARRMYEPSIPAYRIGHLGGAVDFARCVRDRVPCRWCGEPLDRHVFDTYCPPCHSPAGPAGDQ